MKQQRPSLKMYSARSLLLLLLLAGAVSCQKKQEKPWQYFGETADAQASKAKPAQPMP